MHKYMHSDIITNNLWKSIFYISHGFPKNVTKEEYNMYKNFYTSLSFVAPTEQLRKDLLKVMHDNPITDDILYSNKSLLSWNLKIYNEFNILRNEKQISMDELMNWLNINKCYNNRRKNKIMVFFVIIITLVFIRKFFQKVL